MTAVSWTLHDDGVAVVTLDDPEVRNAFSHEMALELHRILDEVAARAGAMVLTATGPAFCVGGDVRSFSERAARGDLLELLVDDMEVFNAAILRLYELPVPTVAAAHGAVAGGGLSLVAACDVRVCDPSTVFVPAFIALGMAPDTGASWLVTRLVGEGRATELFLQNMRLDAERALEWGMVSEVSPDPGGRARELAAALATYPSRAVADTKRLVRRPGAELADRMAQEAEAVARAARSGDLDEGISAFVEKRSPSFPGRRAAP